MGWKDILSDVVFALFKIHLESINCKLDGDLSRPDGHYKYVLSTLPPNPQTTYIP